MIGKEEIEGFEVFKDPYQTEKDYLQDLILYKIYKEETNELVFKGGTALSKFYHSDRFSEDLDFTTWNVNTDQLKFIVNLLDKVITNPDYETKYLEEPSINKFGTVSAKVSIKGPRYNKKTSSIQQIRFEINTKASILTKPIAKSRMPVYPDATNYVALVMEKDEILAEKVRAIMSKGRKHKERDLYDLYYLLTKNTHINKKMIEKKLEESMLSFSDKKLASSINEVKETWNGLVPFVQHNLESYSHVKNFVIAAFK